MLTLSYALMVDNIYLTENSKLKLKYYKFMGWFRGYPLIILRSYKWSLLVRILAENISTRINNFILNEEK
ncbi:hypothetical protein CLROS_040950 [Clostridium felsineum]|nr:hypothetical protein CLROS_040950 [Clostridium felsineum]